MTVPHYRRIAYLWRGYLFEVGRRVAFDCVG